jgi:dimeric dUTPase (all-alpha-NTP-PPase superfamily)
MNFDLMLGLQRELDEDILFKHPLQEGEDRSEKRVLALVVELGELANETRCFKFWSTKGPSEKDIVLEEYIDGIHFFLSIALELNMSRIEKDKLKVYFNSRDTLSGHFLRAISKIIHLGNMKKMDDLGKGQFDLKRTFYSAFAYYLLLGEELGFTKDDIEQMYLKKNAKNLKRQEEGY